MISQRLATATVFCDA